MRLAALVKTTIIVFLVLLAILAIPAEPVQDLVLDKTADRLPGVIYHLPDVSIDIPFIGMINAISVYSWLIIKAILISSLVIGLGYGAKYWWDFHLYLMVVRGSFSQVELELNNLIKKYKGHGSRLQRVKERREWYDTVAKKEPAPVGLFSNSGPFPHTVSDDIIAWNEKEAQSKKTARGQAVETAYYLALLLRGGPGSVRRKIASIKAAGKEPFLVPGVEYLAAQHWRILEYAVKRWKYPRNLVMKKGDEYIRGWDVLNDLLQE